MSKREISPALTEEIHRIATSESKPGGKEVLEELENNPDIDWPLIGPDGELGENYDSALRWVQRRVAEIQKRLKDIDKVFTWPLTEDSVNAGLEWHASDFLLDCWKHDEEQKEVIRSHLGKIARTHGHDLPAGVGAPATIRMALWWWRVHEAAQDLPEDADRVEFSIVNGHRLWAWDYSKDVLEVPIDISSTVDLLRYKPWKSEVHEELYRQAISDGRVKKINRFFGELRDRTGDITQIVQTEPIPDLNLNDAYYSRIGERRSIKTKVTTITKGESEVRLLLDE